jgi:hypothetical protein
VAASTGICRSGASRNPIASAAEMGTIAPAQPGHDRAEVDDVLLTRTRQSGQRAWVIR